MDLNNSNRTERFVFHLNKAEIRSMSFPGLNQFTGIEWLNKDGNSPFPIRYEIEFSNLRYAQKPGVASEFDKEKNIECMTLKSYDALVPNKDRDYAKEYPVSFNGADIQNGCICYTVTTGSCKTGLRSCMLDSRIISTPGRRTEPNVDNK